MPITSGWSKGDYFNDAWKSVTAPTLKKYLVGAKIEVFLPGTGKAVFDPETGKYTYPDSEVPVYKGPARVQPRRSSQDKLSNAADTTIQSVQFQVPLTKENAGLFDVRPKHRVRVTECRLNPILTKYEYVVNEIVDSSNPLEQTFWAKIDQEVKRG